MRDPRTVKAPYIIVTIGGIVTSVVVFLTSNALLVTPLAIIAAFLIFMLVIAIEGSRERHMPSRFWAFAVGAVVTIPVAIMVSILVEPVLGYMGIAPYAVAGVVEEAVKAAALWYLACRWRHINSALDGLIYGTIIAGGFAFTENILYLSSAYDNDLLVETFVVRGLVLTFAHPLFSAASGAGIGWLMGRSRSQSGRWFDSAIVTLGYTVGAFGHGLWNLLSVKESWLYIPIYFSALVFLVIIARNARQHQNRVRANIVEVASNYISAEEKKIILDEKVRNEKRKNLDKKQEKALDIWIWLWTRAAKPSQIIAVSVEADNWHRQWNSSNAIVASDEDYKDTDLREKNEKNYIIEETV
jgi:RsiW-degrading membrane proteinase PrsW (M82 family)